jgi:signal transduction histidine kinase
MFKLLRYFSITSFLAFIVIGAVLVYFYRQQALKEILVLEERKHEDVTNFLYHDFSDGLHRLLTGQALPNAAAFHDEMNHHLEGALAKLEVFNTKGQVVLEVEAHEEDQTQQDKTQQDKTQQSHESEEGHTADPEVLAALAGEIESEYVPSGTMNDEGEQSEHHLIASYIPIRRDTDQTIIGVFEVYSNADDLLAHIERTQRRLVFTLVGLLAGLYVLLLLIVEHGQKILRWQHLQMQEQQALLEREREQLQLEITERKRVEAELAEQSEELLRSNKDLETFAYVASHDLQEPLRKVQTFGDRLMTKYGDTLGEDGKTYLTRMQEALGRMRGLIQDLLVYSRVQNSQKEFVSVDLNEVVRGVISDLEVRLEQSGGRVLLETLPRVQADPLQMRQVFQNLISNALKFKKEGVPPVVQVLAKQVGNSHEIIIKDNGIGFEQQYAERIFEVFQRLQSRGSYEGTGIGLAIVKKILEGHGGEVRAESEMGRGAAFYLSLPVRQQGTKAQPETRAVVA